MSCSALLAAVVMGQWRLLVPLRLATMLGYDYVLQVGHRCAVLQ
jgi:hypothetical protein